MLSEKKIYILVKLILFLLHSESKTINIISEVQNNNCTCLHVYMLLSTMLLSKK